VLLGSVFFGSLGVFGFGGSGLGGPPTPQQTVALKTVANTTDVTKTAGVTFGEMISSELLML